MFELVLEGAKLTENWADVDVHAVFTDVSGAKEVKGFYDGDGLYKVRFLPEYAGEVTWKVTGAVQSEGRTLCEEAEGRRGHTLSMQMAAGFIPLEQRSMDWCIRGNWKRQRWKH